MPKVSAGLTELRPLPVPSRGDIGKHLPLLSDSLSGFLLLKRGFSVLITDLASCERAESRPRAARSCRACVQFPGTLGAVPRPAGQSSFVRQGWGEWGRGGGGGQEGRQFLRITWEQGGQLAYGVFPVSWL